MHSSQWGDRYADTCLLMLNFHWNRIRSLGRRVRQALVLTFTVALILGSSPARAEGVSTAAASPRIYLSVDYQTHSSFGSAVYRSFSPTNLRANVGAVGRNTIDPLNPFRYITSVLVLEAQKQIASGEGLDPKKLFEKLDLKALALGYLGAQGGEMLGAAIQSVLAKSIGPVGGVIGFAVRPVLWYLGSNIGQAAGKALGHGGDPLREGVEVALTEYNPVQDTLQMVGDNVGGVIGQALIPIPVVGGMVGGIFGGVTGLLMSKLVTGSEAGQKIDQKFRSRFRDFADLVNNKKSSGGTSMAGSITVPTIIGDSGPSDSGPSDSGSSDSGPSDSAASHTAQSVAGENSASEKTRKEAAYTALIESIKVGSMSDVTSAYESYGK